ncbi:hypothetical protein Amet_3311 [Alkaliphilus metalliredigens QYMF]|uniref:Uncharacterized protein n=2 Tax=Alkaliphilus TaxID=114627 RepID=A6TTC2_ALKMQ|nr:hypothetical protein Amet_3311 [Alkaliphilus metalliredigens QYMF]
MDQVDTFVESHAQYANENLSDEYTNSREMKEKVILIYGDNELSNRVKAYCDLQNEMWEFITDINDINTESNYKCLLALSYNDVDNLMISSVAFKIYSIPSVIVLCNNQSHLKIYNEFNFDEVLLYSDNIDRLFSAIKGWVEDAVKDQAKI